MSKENNTSNFEYIIVQAGGLGSRMKEYTRNKPKALVPIDNRPMIFHLFKKFPDKKFLIISDYKADVMKKYLKCFAEVEYLVVETSGKKGTCSGIRKAISYIPEEMPFLLIWSDLILPKEFKIPESNLTENYIGISKGFQCRWSYINHNFEEIPSAEHGVAGLFLFNDKILLGDVPEEGEFVAWLKLSHIFFEELPLLKTKEYGLYENVRQTHIRMCRPFNKISIENGKIIKEGIDTQGKELAIKENLWYRKAKDYHIRNIPQIYATNPLVMEEIKGDNPYLIKYSKTEKEKIIRNIVDALMEMHEKYNCSTDYFSINQAYFKKTIKRLEKIRTLVPYANCRDIVINGRKCKNVFFYLDDLEKRIYSYQCNQFQFIHGDCTFSNILIDKTLLPYFIDPRGYFGYTELYGDPMYDWAKLYYSIVGNYDQFNIKKFSLFIADEPEIKLNIESSGWEEMEKFFLEQISQNVDDLHLIHSIIWLSLTTYAWEDYDSICGAFYNGLFYLEEVL